MNRSAKRLATMAAVATTTAALSGCYLGDKRAPDAEACTADLEPAVEVSIIAALTGANLADAAVGEIHDVIDLTPSFVDPLLLFTVDAGEVQTLAAGLERAGTYDVRVRYAGYAEWSDTAVVVAQDTCGPVTEQLTASLAVNPVVAQESGQTAVDETASLITVATCDPAPLGWTGRLENDVVVLERVESGDCLTATDYDEIRLWDAPGLGPQFAAHRIFQLTDQTLTAAPNQVYLRQTDWIAGGAIDIDSYDEAGIVSGRLEGVDGDGDAVELLFWVDLTATRRYR
jgi:hypothetical protein